MASETSLKNYSHNKNMYLTQVVWEKHAEMLKGHCTKSSGFAHMCIVIIFSPVCDFRN